MYVKATFLGEQRNGTGVKMLALYGVGLYLIPDTTYGLLSPTRSVSLTQT